MRVWHNKHREYCKNGEYELKELSRQETIDSIGKTTNKVENYKSVIKKR